MLGKGDFLATFDFEIRINKAHFSLLILYNNSDPL
jgi:hypothetical protein